jgi:hypothetical protein
VAAQQGVGESLDTRHKKLYSGNVDPMIKGLSLEAIEELGLSYLLEESHD